MNARSAIRTISPVFAVLALAVTAIFSPFAAASAGSLVAPAARITDEQARLELARILSYDDRTADEAVRQYEILRADAPGNAEVRLELGRLYSRLKRDAEALAEFNAVLGVRPDDPEALREKGRIHFQRGEFGPAAESLERLHGGGKADAESLRDLGLAYAWSGKFDRAIQAFEAVRRTGGRDPVILIAWGDAELAAGRLTEAGERYRDALARDPSSAEAQRKLGLVLSWSGRSDEAHPLLDAARKKSPEDREVLIELARIAVRKRDYPAALAMLEGLIARHAADAMLLAEAADAAAAAGHARRCRELYRRALSLPGARAVLEKRYASRRTLWGDFYGAEESYREALKVRPDDRETEKDLAGVLAAAQRYEEAEGVWMRRLVLDPSSQNAIWGLSRLKIAQKDSAEALFWADKGLSLYPGSPEGTVLKADALYGMERYAEALEAYRAVGSSPVFHLHVLKRSARIHELAGDRAAARHLYAQAHFVDADDAEIRYRSGRLDGRSPEALLRSALGDGSSRPDRLAAWAAFFAEIGETRSALQCYERALAADAAYFPAQIALAELQGATRDYDRSIALYDELAAAFPESVKILTGKARVLSWAKRYRASMALYEKIQTLNAADPVPRREYARVALWGKFEKEAFRAYENLESPPVGRVLFEDLSPLAGEIEDRNLREALKRLREQPPEGGSFEAYEAFAETAKRGASGREPELGRRIDLALAERHALWRIQKGAALEKKAKRLFWERRPIRALKAYEDLLRFAPGHAEARFDYAQVNCALGLCDREADVYRDLLRTDPLHSLAATALQRQKIRSRPSLRAGQSYWNEDGRGDLARTTRHRTDLAVEVPFWCRHRLKLSGHHWIEAPRAGGSRAADGGSIGIDSVLTPYLRGDAGWTRKSYGDARLGNSDTGHGRLSFHIGDDLLLSGGWERSDELPNGFALRQGIRKDAAWISGSSRPTRRLEVNGKLAAIEYSDENRGRHAALSAGYEFSDHPRIFKIIFSGEYRDTKEGNGYRYDGGSLVDIRHPYWTPQNYTAGEMTLEWHHDLSKLLFCGAESHDYDIRLSFGTDSESNPSVRFEADWKCDFAERWTLDLNGMIHRSREWNAEALGAFLRYRF